MRNLIFTFFALSILASCSSECEFKTDHDLIARLTDEISTLKVQRDDAATDSAKAIYQKEIDQKAAQMDDAFGDCE